MKNYLSINLNIALQVPVPDGKRAKDYLQELTDADILELMTKELNGKGDSTSYIAVRSINSFDEYFDLYQ